MCIDRRLMSVLEPSDAVMTSMCALGPQVMTILWTISLKSC